MSLCQWMLALSWHTQLVCSSMDQVCSELHWLWLHRMDDRFLHIKQICFCNGANLKYVSLRDFSLDYWEHNWAQHFKFESCLREKFLPVLELLGRRINSIYFTGTSEVLKSYARLLMTTSISIKGNLIYQKHYAWTLSWAMPLSPFLPRKKNNCEAEKQMNQAEETMRR